MKGRESFLQGLAVLFCGQNVLGGQVSIEQVILLLSIHLIIYLSSQVVHTVAVKKILLSVDMAYLSVLVIGQYPIFMILLILVLLAYWCDISNPMEKVILLVGILGIGFINIQHILVNWFIYSVLTISEICHYWDRSKLEAFNKQRTILMGQISSLGHAVEASKQEKKQTAYITKVSERNQLAQKLHDKIGHLLAGNVMQLEAIKLIIIKDQAKGLELMTRVIESLRGGMEEVRYTLKELKPAASESGLSQVKGILEGFREKSGIVSELIYKGDLERISLDIWFVIQENLKETLTNFMKYSNGDQFEVKIEVLHQLIKVSFKDNGFIKGPIKSGLGLIGIEERTLGVGGKLILNIDNGFETIMLIKR